MKFFIKLFVILVVITFSLSQENEEAKRFIAEVNKNLEALAYDYSEAEWSFQTNITEETARKSVEASLILNQYMTQAIINASKFDNAPDIDEDTKRQLLLLKISFSTPPLKDAQKSEKLAKLIADMSAIYSAGKYDGKGLSDFEKVISTSRNYDELLQAWENWRKVISNSDMKAMYEEFVQLSNEGAKELGFKDTSELWTAGYETSGFEAVADHLWKQVKPLYTQLHCYVRSKLAKHYGERVDRKGRIPAHLLGNMWAQSWANIWDLVVPYKNISNIDTTEGIKKKGWTPVDMVKFTEEFYTNITFPPFNPEYYAKSMFEKPSDREVVCHASAWDFTRTENGSLKIDTRIKMCIEKKHEDLMVIFHENGHIQYYLNYAKLPFLYRSGAHDGFHEAIGDTVQLSITPKFLYDHGLIDKSETSKEASINQLLSQALSKIAFLPFGLLIDKWRWKVFNGEIKKDNYNEAWWKLVEQFQGVEAPVKRSEKDFDPGAKYHIPANTPYMRYFLAHILQFQFHEALCKIAGHNGPLHECSIAGNTEAGKKYREMLEMGMSKPWRVALESLTGSKEMDASSVLKYFEPLMEWLEAENQNEQCGWPGSEDSPVNILLILGIAVLVILAAIVLLGIGYGVYTLYQKRRRPSYRMMEEEIRFAE